jgi:predicted RNA-binding protein with TRAM domain
MRNDDGIPGETVVKFFREGDEARNGGLTVEISEKLLCLFSAEVTAEDDRYVVEVPRREVETGSVDPGETYRVAVISGDAETVDEESESESAPSEPQPPVENGEIRYVEIEDIGKQGDGIARVERGYVIIVPGGDIGDRVKVEISEVKSNFAVGEIIEEDI